MRGTARDVRTQRSLALALSISLTVVVVAVVALVSYKPQVLATVSVPLSTLTGTALNAVSVSGWALWYTGLQNPASPRHATLASLVEANATTGGPAWNTPPIIELPAVPESQGSLVNVYLFPAAAASVASGVEPTMAFSFDKRLWLRAKAVAVGVYWDVGGGKDNPKCKPESAWLEGVQKHGFPAILLHNCLSPSDALGLDSPRLQTVHVRAAAPSTERWAAEERLPGMVVEWLTVSDVVTDHIFVSFNTKARMEQDPLDFIMRQSSDLFLSQHPASKHFEKRYAYCFREPLPRAGILGDSRRPGLDYVGGRLSAVIQLFQRIRKTLQSALAINWPKDQPPRRESCLQTATQWVAARSLEAVAFA
ncbi:hypothetical protein H632_c11p4 [Helicosporidium sp. ATCC 50920]|nr:hypothetical protein H632_c11p4 [Helicosporidium sp. ATCC 50920]|eukprot:KDD77138.1 hypothetical protein H632_c11p4 [Helicosporidium sp. ATCC 50920]